MPKMSDNPRCQVNIQLNLNMWQVLTDYCNKHDVSRSSVIEKALEAYLEGKS
jgi:metal-responsive CopG/Arc/MetJ family transcriptional regulator